MTTSTEPPNTLTKQTPKAQIRDLLQGEEFKRQVAKALPRWMSAERFARIALNATLRNPKLLNCSRDSFFKCLLELSAMGLEPDGRRAHLIPFKDECTLIVDYRGIAELLRRNGEVAYIHCDVVYASDHFEYRFGTGGKLEHIPATGDRGPLRCVYSFIRLKDGTEEYDVMSIEDVQRIRGRSRAASDGPWVTDFNEMAKKTIFRRHSKMLPISPELREVIEHDDEALTETERFAAAKPVTATVSGAAPRGRSPKQKINESRFEPDPEQAAETPQITQDRFSGAGSDNVAGQAQNAPETAPEPQPPEPEPAVSLVERIGVLLGENGSTQAELLELLRRVKLAKTEKSLAEVSDTALSTVLEDWANCARRLAEIRQQRKP